VDLEWHQLELRHRHLRLPDPTRKARLMASLADEGQLHPVVVVAGKTAGQDRYLLVDGYLRVEALRALGRDTVRAMALPLDEAEALVLGHRLENARRRTALEEGWLVRELHRIHGWSQEELARRLHRSTAWVSGRLALARDLPREVEERVRDGRLGAYAAAKYLVPFARAKPEDCQQLVRALGKARLSVRQVERLYAASGRLQGAARARFLAAPLLYLRAEEAAAAREDEVEASTPEGVVLRDLGAIQGICRRVARRLVEGGGDKPERGPAPSVRVRRAWGATKRAYQELAATLEEEESDVEREATGRDPGAEIQGQRIPEDRAGAEGLPDRGPRGADERDRGGAQDPAEIPGVRARGEDPPAP
jgi:ParB family chromosome partitioning protein